MNRLSISTRISHIYEAGGDTRILDFMIDGSSIAERVQKAAPYTEGGLVGVTEWRALLDGDLFLTGQHPDFNGPHAGFLPLLVCSDCGSCWCGAVWTRFSISGASVIWDGLGWMDDNVWEPLGESRQFHFEIGHYRDVISTARLAAEQLPAISP
jgi:hypothetical protein